MKYERKAWAFLRTWASDYRYGAKLLSDGTIGYPLLRLGPDFNPHLRCFLFDPGVPQRVRLYETRALARADAKARDEHGRVVHVRILVEVV